MSNWISVEDRLPDPKQAVLRWYKVSQLPYNTNIGVGYVTAEVKSVTHWMPLPEPPTGEDDE